MFLSCSRSDHRLHTTSSNCQCCACRNKLSPTHNASLYTLPKRNNVTMRR